MVTNYETLLTPHICLTDWWVKKKEPTLTRGEGGLIINPLKKLIQFYQTMNEIELKIDSN